MTGTVLLTGANGTLALGFVESFLSQYPEHTLVATVRNASPEKDANTAKLAALISKYPKAKVHIETLDLGDLANVRSFTNNLSTRITDKELPRISAIVCNAAAFHLETGQTSTTDGFDATFQVCHLSHYLLVLKLLGGMDNQEGRIVMLGSITHYPEMANPLSSLRPGFPENMEELVKPDPDPPGLVHDKGFQRYGTAKLANVTFAADLNARLKKDSKLSHITALAMDPGGIPSSRAQSEQKRFVRIIFAVMNFLMPVLKHLTTTFRTSADAGRDLVALSVGSAFHGKEGYFVGQVQGKPAAISGDKEAQERLWEACWRWAGMTAGETALENH